MIDRVCIWRELTGGGSAVDYLRWLAAMWEQYRIEAPDLPGHLLRSAFDEWLYVRVNRGGL